MDNSVSRVLQLPSEAWGDLIGGALENRRLRYVVRSTDFTRAWRVALVVVNDYVVGAAIVRKYSSPNARQHDLEFRAAENFSNPAHWERLAGELSATLRRHLERRDGNALPPKTGWALERALTQQSPDAEGVLARMREDVNPSSTSGGVGALLREQRDAVALGLEIAGIGSRESLGDVRDDDVTVPFLTGLGRRRVSEAATLRHDSTVFDEWLPGQADHFDTATFRDPDDPARRVTVFYADKEELERQTGTDLLYYRHDPPSFILVQYKRMRSPDGAEHSRPSYYPDHQLQTELARFRALPAGEVATTQDWRLSEDAFFLKLVRDDLGKPAGNRLVWGMYLPLSLVELLLKDAEEERRPRGWSPGSITTYLSNQEFLGLAKQGYVGSRGALTQHLQDLITRSFVAGRGVILTVDETDPGLSRRLRHG